MNFKLFPIFLIVSFVSTLCATQNRSWIGYFNADYVTSIAVENNLVWVGLDRNGLVCLNRTSGQKTFYNNITTNLPISWVSSISIDKRGNKWVAGGGLFKYDNKKWVMYSPSNSGLPTDQIYDIYIDSVENVWLATYGFGLIRFDGLNWTKFNTSNCGIPSNEIWAITSDSTGALWLGTSDGIARFDGKNWLVYDTTNSSLPINNVISIAVDLQGELWAGTTYSPKGGLARLSHGAWTIYDYQTIGFNSIETIAIDSIGNRWFGGMGGLVKYDGRNWSIFNESNSSLTSSYIISLFVDSTQSLCVGSNSLIYRSNTHIGGLTIFTNSTSISYDLSNSALPQNNITSIAKGKNNIFWLTTTSNILINIRNGLWSISRIPNSGVNSSSAVDFNGNLWIGSYLGGLKKYEGQKWFEYSSSNSLLTRDDATKVVIDLFGNVWVLNVTNVIRISPSEWTVYNYQNSILPYGSADAIACDKHGNVWVSIGNKLAKFDGSQWICIDLPSEVNEVNTLAVDQNDEIWLGTEYSGVFMFNGKTWTTYNVGNSLLPSSSVKVIKVDKRNVVWIGTATMIGGGGAGLARIENQKWESFKYLNSGLAMGDISDIAFDDSNQVWITHFDSGVSILHEDISEDTTIVNSPLPASFRLIQNYPNPFNASTTIHYEIPIKSYVTLKIFDNLGREIGTLVNGLKTQGYYSAVWNASNFGSGVYYCLIHAGNFVQSMKLVLLK